MPTIFTFASNLAGIHGAGSAKHAYLHHGAIWGQGTGLHGDSYAIPTKDTNLRTLPLSTIRRYVASFLLFAKSRPDLQFTVVAIGTGLAGYAPSDIAPMFSGATENVHLPPQFISVLQDKPQYTKFNGEPWWCKSHNRPATHILIYRDGRQAHVCDPSLGGIMIPCECTEAR